MRTWNFQMRTMFASSLAVLLMAGCATKVEPVRSVTATVKPDMIIVHDFAVSGVDVQLDDGIGAKIKRNHGDIDQNEEELATANAVAKELTAVLVRELNNAGIKAVSGGTGVSTTDRTVNIRGAFTTIDEGNRTSRSVIGFGLGRSIVRTRGIVYQGTPPDERLVGEFVSETRSGLKPGMGAVGAAQGSIAVSAASTVASEKFLTAVEKDAKGTAKKIAKRIKVYYKDRGWL